MTEAAGPKKSSGWKLFGIIAGALAVGAVALVIAVSSLGSAKSLRLETAARARIAELKSAPTTRPTLRGGSEPGDAWDDYAPALEEVKAFPNANKFFELVRREPKADPELGKAALAGLAKAIEGLHRGAGRAGSRYPYEWDKGAAMTLPSLIPCTNLANLLVLKARSLAEEGKGRESAGVLLDLLQFGRDLGGDGLLISEMLGYSAMAIGMTELVDQLAAEKFDKPALEDLDRGLAVLEGSLPDHGQILKTESLLFGSLADPSITGTWGPQRFVFACAVEDGIRMMDRAAKTDAMPWGEAQKECQAMEAEMEASWNPIFKMATPSTTRTHQTIRQRRAQIRMLRTAVHQRATGDLLDLDDPFGTKLKTAKSGTGLKVWSLGLNGIDDGGTGDWKGNEKDIVLELKGK